MQRLGLGSEAFMTEGQIVILPAGHPLAAHSALSLAQLVRTTAQLRVPRSDT
ncbi:LysR family transcriptional regulator [Streptomyces paromomycinus]|uniref:LysR family transcriptional regulator n=1 Tax=Streptomyces paromomycinus TaxID=92743 RepID=A0A401VUF7_STREY|nr:LysR family transcriptional regulator [Streptomyces paromomycinus]